MVVASPEADERCIESTGLTVVELLRPFGLLPQLNGNVGGKARRRAPCTPVLLHINP